MPPPTREQEAWSRLVADVRPATGLEPAEIRGRLDVVPTGAGATRSFDISRAGVTSRAQFVGPNRVVFSASNDSAEAVWMLDLESKKLERVVEEGYLQGTPSPTGCAKK